MANTQKGGFTPIKSRYGAVEFARRRVLSNNTYAIYCHDAVVLDANGDCLVATTANTAVASVACGCSYVNSSSERVERHHLPAATTYTGTTVNSSDAAYCYIVADPVNVDFEASVDEALTLTGLNLNYVMVLTTGSTTTGYSKQELDATGAAVTATFPWRVKEFIIRADNDVDLADAAVICSVNAGLGAPAIDGSTGL